MPLAKKGLKCYNWSHETQDKEDSMRKLIQLKKPTARQVKVFLLHSLVIVLGNAIAAMAPAFFIIPSNLTIGGTTGLGVLMGHFWKNEFAVSLTVYVVNAALFILGAALLGKRFALATLAGTLLYPSFLSLWTAVENVYEEQVGAPIAADSPILAAICGAMAFGFGIGIVVRVGASTGGTDIPALIFHKFFNIPVSIGLWTTDLLIIFVQFFVTSVEAVLYGIIVSILSSVIVDQVSIVGTKRAQVQIVSKKYREIREMILNKLNRGVTMLYAKTGFLQERCFVLMTVVSNRDMVRLRNEVQAIDPEAFLMVNMIGEVRGRGFSSEKIALPKSEESTDEEDTPPIP